MLVGKFVIVDDHDSYRMAKIVGSIRDEVFLVQFDNMIGAAQPMPMELVSLDQMTGIASPYMWQFFDSEESRLQYLNWLDAPSPPRVVSLVAERKSK